jgi:hypothetical protein
MPKGIFYNGMSKKEVAHNTAVFTIILSNEENALTKGLMKLGSFANKLWTSEEDELLSLYQEYRDKVVDKLAELNSKRMPTTALSEIIKNGYVGITDWNDNEIIEFAMDNYDEVKQN